MKNNDIVKAGDPRLQEGWRAGKPSEDPDKIKRWGWITAKPSEHLIHVRGGMVTDRSGQGASCFKWPWDSVAVVPTSLQRLQFRADQVTLEKVGVEIVGFAVFRIADPLLAFRVLNFSFPERAQQKLVETLTSMFIGGTRRIVATLSLEDCLRKRKSALAEELLREIAPVVSGSGRPDDETDRGWGVVIDTIEIQEVRVLSQAVFSAMQAPYRAELEQRARVAKTVADQAIAEGEARCRRETEIARLAVEQELARRRAEADQADAETAAERALRAIELESAHDEAASRAHGVRLAAQEKSSELERRAAALRAELARLAIDTAHAEGLAQAAVALQRAEAAARQADADARLELARQLPALAKALGERMGEVHLTHIGGDTTPFAQLAAGLAAIVDVARRA